MKLRLGISDRAIHDLRNLVVLVPLDIVQHEYVPVSRRQRFDRLRKPDAVDRTEEPEVILPEVSLDGFVMGRVGFVERNNRETFLSHPHQHDVHHQAMQPGGKGGVAAEGRYFPKKLKKSLLCQIFSVRRVAGHAQAQGVNAPVVRRVKRLKRRLVALLRARDQLSVGCGLCR